MQKQQTIAYLRVSTTDQDLEKNKFDILKLANEKGLGQVQWVEETVSGRVSWRKRHIATILERLQTGDNLIVSELSRLGRSMLECMEILSIASQREIKVYAVCDTSYPPRHFVVGSTEVRGGWNAPRSQRRIEKKAQAHSP